MQRKSWFQLRMYPPLQIIAVLMLAALLLSQLRPAVAATASTPILLVLNDAAPNKFGAYVAEILRAEGLNAYTVAQLSALTTNDLSGQPLVILAETPVTDAQATLFSNYVNGGGRLLALRPDTRLAALFGLTPANETQTDGYLKIDTSQPSGQGLPTETLQIHGEADRYTLNGATAIAGLYSDATTATAHPAVTVASADQGRAAAFTYDLAKNVVYFRQGNPANADVDTDGDGVLRTVDLFHAKGDGATWVDRDKVAIPQADIQQRLFARLIHQLLDDVIPLPQLWYFPSTAKAVLIPTGDAHANPIDYYKKEIDSLAAHGGTMTFYLSAAGDPPADLVKQWMKQGFTFGIHPYSNKPDPNPTVNITNLDQGYKNFEQWFTTSFGTSPSPTVRHHQVAWKGWTDAADIAVANGVALDANFYHWGLWLKKSDGTWPHGYITGSGQPMKFIRADGTVLPLYQQLTQLSDEQLIGVVSGAGYEQLNGSQAVEVSQEMIDASLAGDYAALMTQFHVDYYGFGDPQVWAEGTLDYARSKNVPIWNADQWLNFTTTRHDGEFQEIAWDSANGRLTFTLSTAATSNTLSVLLPPTFSRGSLEGVQVDGAPAQLTDFEVSGRKLALVAVKAGKHTYEVRYSGQQAAPTAAPTAPEIPTVASEISTVVPTLPSPDVPTSVPASGISPSLPQASVPPIFWAIAAVVIVLVAVVAFLVGRGRSSRR
jgi:hypothetical protein